MWSLLVVLLAIGVQGQGSLRSGLGATVQGEQGDYFVTGSFEGTAMLDYKQVCTEETCTKVPAVALVSRGRADVYVAKYDMRHRLLWAVQVGGAGDDRPGGLAYEKHTGQIHAAGQGSLRQATLSDTAIFVTGTIQGDATLGPWSLAASQRLGEAPFLAKLNATSGETLWARSVGDCRTQDHHSNRSHIVHEAVDPRSMFMDTLGECEVQGIALDGAGAAVLTGRLFGILDLPPTMRFTFEPRTYFGSLHAAKLSDRVTEDPIEIALGFVSFPEAFPTMSNESFSLELEEEESGDSLASKISALLNVPASWISLLQTDGSPLRVPLVKGQSGYNQYNPYPYMERTQVQPTERITAHTVVGRSLMVQICNSTWKKSTREDAGDDTSIQNLLDRSVACSSVRNAQTGQTDWFCPRICTRHSECVGDSMCIDEVCHALQPYCANITVTLVSNSLRSDKRCHVAAASGRTCVFETWITKFDRDGLFRWGNTLTAATATIYNNATEQQSEEAYWAQRASENLESSIEGHPGHASRVFDNFPAATSTSGNANKYTIHAP